MFKCLKRSFELITNIFVCRKGKPNVSHRKGMRIINPMESHFILALVVKKNGIFAFWGFSCYRKKIFSERDVWFVIMNFFSVVLGIYSIRQKFNFQKSSLLWWKLYLWRISIKLRKSNMLTMMEINKSIHF